MICYECGKPTVYTFTLCERCLINSIYESILFTHGYTNQTTKYRAPNGYGFVTLKNESWLNDPDNDDQFEDDEMCCVIEADKVHKARICQLIALEYENEELKKKIKELTAPEA